MISALAWSHILHINKASVSEFLSQANRPTSTITNKLIQESQMAYLKQPRLLPEQDKPEPWNQSWLQTVFPWALGASKTAHKLAPLEKNTNDGTIHYLELVGGQYLPLQKILSCRYNEGRWKVQHTSAGVGVVQHSLSPSLAGFFADFGNPCLQPGTPAQLSLLYIVCTWQLGGFTYLIQVSYLISRTGL